ncbi:MAG: NAD(P)-binding oxidoreductase [Ornithinimicrobium sp.]
MLVLVVGASRGTGAAMVRELVSAGHGVTGFARSAPVDPVPGATYVAGDVMDAESIGKAVAGQAAVIVALGISDHPIAVRLLRRASTPLDVRSAGTGVVVQAMQESGVRRLVVQSTYGVGDTYARLSPMLKFVFSAVLRPQVDDSARQESVVTRSGLDWTILRPVALHDGEAEHPVTVRTDDTVVGMRVARRQVAQVAASALGDSATISQVLSVSHE